MDYGILSLFPIALTIVIAMWLKNISIALFAGAFAIYRGLLRLRQFQFFVWYHGVLQQQTAQFAQARQLLPESAQQNRYQYSFSEIYFYHISIRLFCKIRPKTTWHIFCSICVT